MSIGNVRQQVPYGCGAGETGSPWHSEPNILTGHGIWHGMVYSKMFCPLRYVDQAFGFNPGTEGGVAFHRWSASAARESHIHQTRFR